VKIKAITLIQPWASLIAWGEKGIETRSWSAKYKGQLAIHAGAKIDYEACEYPAIRAALRRHGINKPSELPTSCILSVCQIFDCVRMVESAGPFGVKVPGYKLSEKEHAFGDYQPGRYAWILANVKRPATPIPAKGKMMLWDFDMTTAKFAGQEWD